MVNQLTENAVDYVVRSCGFVGDEGMENRAEEECTTVRRKQSSVHVEDCVCRLVI